MKRCLNCNLAFTSKLWVCPSCNWAPQMCDGVPCFAPEFADESEGYDSARYEATVHFQGEHFWFRGRNKLICSQLENYFPRAGTLLEVGCGTGHVLQAIRQVLPTAKLYGSEIHLRGLKYALEVLPKIQLFQLDARVIPFFEEFDVVCAFDVIEHIVDDRRVLREMYQSCRPGGGVLITVPQHGWLWSHRDEVACHKRRYACAELKEKVRDAGFEVVRTSSFVSLLLPIMYMSRLRKRGQSICKQNSEFRIPRLMNRFFLACSRFENALIAKGFNLPWGGSLILIGRKPIL